LKVVVKGIMSKEDALLCLSNGADGIWISNGEGAK
jgi:isopentenyl diphosphate isomerase/L-lactate dehydrogenase-like FMN-dependent dehydrogenase